MRRSPLRRRSIRPTAWSLPAIALLCLLLSLSLLAAACGGDDGDVPVTTAAASGSGETPETTAAAPAGGAGDFSKMGGTELATNVIKTWNEALAKLTTLLEGMPAAAGVQSQVADLKEEYVQKFVALGRQHKTFDEEQLRLWRIELGINSPEAYAGYQEIANKYIMDSATSTEFKDLIKDFNIITQYSDFTLLKQQEPEEAARLGVE